MQEAKGPLVDLKQILRNKYSMCDIKLAASNPEIIELISHHL